MPYVVPMWKGEWSKSDNHVLLFSFKYLSDGHIIIVDCEIFSLWYYVSKALFSYFDFSFNLSYSCCAC
jgi:hypothetical protein